MVHHLKNSGWSSSKHTSLTKNWVTTMVHRVWIPLRRAEVRSSSWRHWRRSGACCAITMRNYRSDGGSNWGRNHQCIHHLFALPAGGLEHYFYDFPFLGNDNPNWRTHIFQRGRYTTKQTNEYSIWWSCVVESKIESRTWMFKDIFWWISEILIWFSMVFHGFLF